jgi:flagellar hook-length control protein FliK
MIENISNIGQMLTFAGGVSQGDSGRRQASRYSRFYIDDDNPDQETDRRKALKTKANPDNRKKERANPAAASAVNDPDVNAKSDKGLTTEEDVPVDSEKSNSVTGHAVKSEQIKLLHETEKGQLGIKTILPEKSNGQNGLKDVSGQSDINADGVLSEKLSRENTEQTDNETAAQVEKRSLKEALNGSEQSVQINKNGSSESSHINQKQNEQNADSQENDANSKDKNTLGPGDKIFIEEVLSNSDTNAAAKPAGIAAAKVNSNIAAENPDTDISAQIGRQITESIHSSMTRGQTDRQITVRLNPPELGSVVIKFSEHANQLTGILEVGKPETKIEIEHALGHIIRNLSESGIQLRKIDVVSSHTSHPDNDSLKDQLPWDNNSNQSNQHSSASQQQGGGDFGRTGFQQWFSNSIAYRQNYARENVFAASGSINMLM